MESLTKDISSRFIALLSSQHTTNFVSSEPTSENSAANDIIPLVNDSNTNVIAEVGLSYGGRVEKPTTVLASPWGFAVLLYGDKEPASSHDPKKKTKKAKRLSVESGFAAAFLQQEHSKHDRCVARPKGSCSSIESALLLSRRRRRLSVEYARKVDSPVSVGCPDVLPDLRSVQLLSRRRRPP